MTVVCENCKHCAGLRKYKKVEVCRCISTDIQNEPKSGGVFYYDENQLILKAAPIDIGEKFRNKCKYWVRYKSGKDNYYWKACILGPFNTDHGSY